MRVRVPNGARMGKVVTRGGSAEVRVVLVVMRDATDRGAGGETRVLKPDGAVVIDEHASTSIRRTPTHELQPGERHV